MQISQREAEARRHLYENGGEAIGEFLCRYPEEEPTIWRMVAGAGLWTRKDLAAFKSLWRRDNPRAHQVIRQMRYERKLRARRKASRLRESREACKPQAMPTERRPRKDLGERS
jgi:hypothetical protein